MRKTIFCPNVSLDGCADHRMAFADEELLDFFTALLSGVDAVLFGRMAYQLFESYWPTAPQDPSATRSMVAFARRINAMPKIVFSNTLEKAEWNNTRLVRGDAGEEVSRLKQQPGKDLSITGFSLASTLMQKGLIDEYWLMVQPVVWGSGKRLFEGLKDKVKLKLADTRTFKSGVVVLHYLNPNCV
jgi:dihydrofolate reductase